MGTRCLTVIKEGDKSSSDICVIYRQMDGYPSGHGEDIKRLIGNIVVTNGYLGEDTTVANGMGCLAAQLVTGLKLDVLKHNEKMIEWRKKILPQLPDCKAGMAGGIYICSAGTRDICDYTYTIYLIKVEKEQEDDLVDSFFAGELYLMVESHGGISDIHGKSMYDGLLREFSSEACNFEGD